MSAADMAMVHGEQADLKVFTDGPKRCAVALVVKDERA